VLAARRRKAAVAAKEAPARGQQGGFMRGFFGSGEDAAFGPSDDEVADCARPRP